MRVPEALRVPVHVRPNASLRAVGGSYDGALVVRVVEAPYGGRATNAAIGALARALDLPPSSVSLVRGASSRRKLVQVECSQGDRPRVEGLIEALLAERRPTDRPDD